MITRNTTRDSIKRLLTGLKVGKRDKRELSIEEQISQKQKELEETKKLVKDYSIALGKANEKYEECKSNNEPTIEVPEEYINIYNPFDSRIYYENYLRGLKKKEVRLQKELEMLKSKLNK